MISFWRGWALNFELVFKETNPLTGDTQKGDYGVVRARYGYGTSVSDKEGRGDDQMRCSCLIRGHPRGGCASLLSFSVPS